MKKLILFAGMAMVFLTGCQGTMEREKKVQREAENKAIINSLRIVEYNGHSYIIYRETLGTKNFGGITHDPDCDCERIKGYGYDVVKIYDYEEDNPVQ